MDFRTVHARMRLIALVVIGCLGVAALSALVVAPAPAYDPWSWLLWGREVAHGTLSTAEGPAFKPLPVAVCALLAPLGDDVAPVTWVILARAAAVLAVALAFVVGRRLGGTSAGVLAAGGVALCGAFPRYAASGDVTGLFVALVLLGVLAWWAGTPRAVCACAVACALLRVEAWPFAVAVGVLLWRSDVGSGRGASRRSGATAARLRPWLAAAAVLVPVAWFLPEWIGSGDVLRSGDRARIPNLGQPAEADFPFVASLDDALSLPLWPLLAAASGLAAGVVAAARGRHFVAGWQPGARAAAWLAAAGAVWVLLVAVMAEAGFSGEARYALPGAALLAIAGAVAIAGLPRAAVIAGALVVAAVAVPRLVDLGDLRLDQRHQWRLARDLPGAIDLAGGRAAVLDCGTPYTGPYRGALLAYRLDVAKEDVEPDAAPSPPGVVFRSRRLRDARPTPSTAGFDDTGRAGPWEVGARCR